MTRKGWIRTGVVLAIAGSAVGAGSWWSFWRPEARAALGPVSVASRGPMTVTVTEGGEVEAASRTVIGNELRSAAIITYVVPDGTFVSKGSKIIEFECTELEDTITKQTSVVESGLTAFSSSQKSLELKKDETTEKVRKAVDALNDANQDLTRYEEGEWKIKKDKADSDIQLAERDLKLTQDKLEFKLKVNKEMQENSPYSENEIEADKLSVQRLDIAWKSAISARDLLDRFDHERDLRKLRGAVRDTELGLKRAELEKEMQVGLAKADMDDKERLYNTAKTELQREKDEFDKRIRMAESDGLVVYDTGGRWYENITVAVGEKIAPRQQIMIIPNMETLRVKTRVYEAVIDQVEKGQRAYIRLDSRPDLVLTGEVESVGVLPSKQDRWLSPDVKVFEVFIKLDNKPEGLKPNLTAQVEIVLAELKDVLHVPVAAVFTEQELTYCWRLASEKPARAPIKVGRMNDAQVEVVSGLNEGDRVLLKPPEGTASGKGLKSGSSSTRPAGTTMPNGKELRTPGREEGTGRPGGERPGRPRKEGGSQPTTKEAFRVPSAMPASTSRTSDPGRS